MTAHVYKYELVFINIKNISTFLSEHIPLFHMLPQISRVFTVIHTVFTYVHRRHVHKAVHKVRPVHEVRKQGSYMR